MECSDGNKTVCSKSKYCESACGDIGQCEKCDHVNSVGSSKSTDFQGSTDIGADGDICRAKEKVHSLDNVCAIHDVKMKNNTGGRKSRFLALFNRGSIKRRHTSRDADSFTSVEGEQLALQSSAVFMSCLRRCCGSASGGRKLKNAIIH
jgi:hypothetical protein